MRNNPVTAALLGCAVCASFPAGAAAAPAAAFAIYEIATGAARHQTVLDGAFGGGARLAVVSIDAGARQRVRFYGFDGSAWNVVYDAPLAPGVEFVDVLGTRGRDRLLLYRSDGISWLDPDDALERRLADASPAVGGPEDGSAPRVDITRDLNGDGLDDLVLPTFDGFRITLQAPDGSFGAAVALGPPPPYLDGRAYGEPLSLRETGFTPESIPWHVARVHALDYDRDGRPDLAFWNGDRFDVHLQDETGGFRAVPVAFAPGVAFDFDGGYALAHHIGDAGALSLLLGLRRRAEHRALHGLPDVDADGIADLVILAMRGRSPLRLRGRIEIHFGRSAPNGTVFDATPGATVRTPGRAAGGEPWGYAWHSLEDLDGDGALDLALGAVNTSGAGMLGALVGNSVSVDLAFHRLRGRALPVRADSARRVKTAFRPLSRRGPQFPTVLVGDVDGDGRADLLIGERWNELAVHIGTAGADPFAKRPIRVPVALPADGQRHVRLADLHGDGLRSVVIAHASASGPNRVVVVTAR